MRLLRPYEFVWKIPCIVLGSPASVLLDTESARDQYASRCFSFKPSLMSLSKYIV